MKTEPSITITPANVRVYEKIKEACLGEDDEIPAFVEITKEKKGMTREKRD